MRLVWYPIAQAFNRIGYTWYNTQYGAYRDFNDMTTDKFIAMMFISLAAVVVSVSYFTIFLIMQPTAYAHFLALIHCKAYERSHHHAADDNNNDDDTLQDDEYITDNRVDQQGTAKKNDVIDTTTGASRMSQSAWQARTSQLPQDRESMMRYSFQDLRTDEELLHIIDEEFIAHGVSMFTTSVDDSPSTAIISLQMIGNPILLSRDRKEG
jgi:hypothetical protein